jgi:hypothetical protein
MTATDGGNGGNAGAISTKTDKSEATPRSPYGHRVRSRLSPEINRWSLQTASLQLASLPSIVSEPGARRTSTRRARRALRFALPPLAWIHRKSPKRFGCGAFAPRRECRLAFAGGVEPQAVRPNQRLNRSLQVRDSNPRPSSFELLALPTELPCGGTAHVLRGTRCSSTTPRQFDSRIDTVDTKRKHRPL